MILNREIGGYARGGVIRLYGSFQTNGTNPPTVIRDGHSACIASVVRTSPGLYLVTLDTGFPVPERMVIERASKQGVAVSARSCTVEVVVGSWSQSARTFSIVCNVVGDTALAAYTDPAPGDPDTGDRIGFELVGSIDSTGTDLA